MKRGADGKVHATCGDLASIGLERVSAWKVVDGRDILLWRHPLYARWKEILRRAAWKCPYAMSYKKTGPYYADCTVCDEWLDFTNFYRWAMANGYSQELEIDRIDNTRGYSPENCRWVTHAEQMRNRRMTEKMRAANLRNLAKANAANAARRAAARKEGAA